MHNNIMAAGSRDRPPMLATGRYAQWQSRFLRYIDTRTNSDALRKCILEGPYEPTTVTISAVPTIDDTPAVPERTTIETILTMSPENKAYYESEKEAIHLLLTRIGDEIYSTVDACKTAHEMWIAYSISSTRFYKMMNEMIRNNLTVASCKSISISSTTLTQNCQGKDIAKPITPPSKSAFKEDSDPEQAQRDKDMQKNLALIAKYFKKIYKPTNNNLKTSSNSRNKNVDTSLRYKNDNQTGQFRNQRMVTVAGARETIGKEMDEDIDEHELEAHYRFMEKIQEVPTADSGTNIDPLEQVQYHAEYNVFANVRQHSEQPESTSNTCLME
ncbi:hypothetical protein Tco_0498918 [Tanacetum coccineum]